MRLLLLISALWICVGCGSSGDRIPLEMQAREPSVAESVAAVQLTFDPSEDEPIEVVEASMRIDASTPLEPEILVEYEYRDFLVRVQFPEDETIDEALELEYGIGDYTELDTGATRMLPSVAIGVVSVTRESHRTNLGFVKFTVPIVKVEGERENPVRAWVRPTTIGWQRRRAWSPTSYDKELPADLYRDLGRYGVEEDGMNVIYVSARRGVTVAGIVLNPEGEPVDNGRVYLKRHTSRRRTRTDNRTNIGFDGRFEMHISRKATYTLRATVNEVGVGEIKELEIDATGEPLELVINLVGPGTIEGFVRDQHGLPVPGFPVYMKRKGDLVEASVVVPEDVAAADSAAADAAVADVSEGETSEGDPPGEEIPVIDQTIGLTSLTVTTDADGHFIAKGLRPGTYSMYQRTIRNNDTKLIQKGVQTTWEDPIELVVKATRILVSVYEPGSGGPVPWVPKGHSVEGREMLGAMIKAPNGQQRGKYRWRQTEEEHTWALWAQPGHEYRILLGSSKRKYVERTVLVNPGQDRLEVAITLSAKIEAAVLRVFATDPPGTKGVSGHFVNMYSLRADVDVTSASSSELGGVMEMTVAPGSYRVTVAPQGKPWMWGRGPGEDRTVLPKQHTAVLDLAPASITNLYVETLPSGGIQLTLAMPPILDLDLGPSRNSDHPTIKVRGNGPNGETAKLEINSYAVYYYRDRGKPHALSPSGSLSSLTPGSWQLEIEAPGFDPIETWVDVEHGQSAVSSVNLKPKSAEPTPLEDR